MLNKCSFRISNPTSKPSGASPVTIKAPKELPKVSLVNESLKMLKFHFAKFENVVKIRTTHDARTEVSHLQRDFRPPQPITSNRRHLTISRLTIVIPTTISITSSSPITSSTLSKHQQKVGRRECSGVPGRAPGMSTCRISQCSSVPGRAPIMSTCPLSQMLMCARARSAHHIQHNLFKSSNHATLSGKATKSKDDFSLRLTSILKNGFNNQPQNPKLSDNLQINLKLNNQNYTLWTRMIRVAIGGKSKARLSHLTSDAPEQSSETYEQWEQEDLIVFSWLIQNIKPTLAGNLTKYHTAKTLWDTLVITYISGIDKLQTFNLHVKANDIKQNKTHLKCGNCGMTRHNTEHCFELLGYPDWWNDGHKKGNKNQGPERGKAFATNTDTDLKSPTGFEGMAATTINEEDESSQ
nr:putative Gag-polypeptide of LTR copia-type [Tanacetum cinerariifolium]